MEGTVPDLELALRMAYDDDCKNAILTDQGELLTQQRTHRCPVIRLRDQRQAYIGVMDLIGGEYL